MQETLAKENYSGLSQQMRHLTMNALTRVVAAGF